VRRLRNPAKGLNKRRPADDPDGCVTRHRFVQIQGPKPRLAGSSERLFVAHATFSCYRGLISHGSGSDSPLPKGSRAPSHPAPLPDATQ
jgi:hypothetical protein